MSKVVLKRVGILSVAKWQALVGAATGFFMGILYSYSYGEGRGGAILYYLISTPIFYGVISFLATALCGLIYNAAAGTVGGILLEFEDATSARLPPLPPDFE
jgi:hypothetical protein